MTDDHRLPLVRACPRCDESDERSPGANTCGLCGCEFVVGDRVYFADYSPVDLPEEPQ